MAALVVVLVAGARSTPSADAVTRFAPAFTAPDLRTPSASFEFDGKPTKPTVVNFFAAWCEPCKEELPLFSAASRANPGIDFIGVDVRDVRSQAIALLEQHGIGFPAAFDRDRRVADAFQLAGMPTTVFIAPGGRVVSSFKGAISKGELAKQLDRLEAA